MNPALTIARPSVSRYETWRLKYISTQIAINGMKEFNTCQVLFQLSGVWYRFTISIHSGRPLDGVFFETAIFSLLSGETFEGYYKCSPAFSGYLRKILINSYTSFRNQRQIIMPHSTNPRLRSSRRSSTFCVSIRGPRVLLLQQVRPAIGSVQAGSTGHRAR